MKIKIENLGAVYRGELDMSKPLIIMCGPNSTGKTYVSHILYSLYFNKYRISPNCFNVLLKELDVNGRAQLKKEYLDEFLEAEISVIKNFLDSVFGISEDEKKRLFRNFRLTLSLDDKNYKQVCEKKFACSLGIYEGQVRLKKEAGSDEIVFENQTGNQSLKLESLPFGEFLIYNLLHDCAFYPVNNVRMLTVERNSIYTFSKELSLSRNELIDRLQDAGNGKLDVMDILGQESKRYPMAIRESLKIANDLENLQKYKSDFTACAEQLEKDILQGKLLINKYGSVEFQPETNTKTVRRLQIHMSSSIVKTLTSLILYLKHLARKGDLLIIDEPEMNLHPNNQILLARIFARLVNHGLRLVISTHSDYIIREFNNLIMAHEMVSDSKLSNISVTYDKTELLDRKKLEVVYFSPLPSNNKKTVMKSVEVTRYGFNVSSIDDTINHQNEVSDSLYEYLRYGL